MNTNITVRVDSEDALYRLKFALLGVPGAEITTESTEAPDTVVQATAALVDYNWSDEERDYNTEALVEDNSREGHIFESIMLIQRWLETAHGYPHIEPRIEPDPRVWCEVNDCDRDAASCYCGAAHCAIHPHEH